MGREECVRHAAEAQNGNEVERATAALQGDKEVVLAAVAQNVNALEYNAASALRVSALRVDADCIAMLAALESTEAALLAKDDFVLAMSDVVVDPRAARLARSLKEFVDDRDDRDERGGGAGGINRTALHLAAEAGHAKVVRALLHHGADPRTLDSGNRSALLVAASLGHEDVAWQLTFGIEMSARVEGEARDVWSKTLGTVSKELRQKDGWTPLHAAAYSNHYRVVRLLLDFGERVLSPVDFLRFVNAEHSGKSQRRRTPLQMAAARGHRATVDVFAAHAAADFRATDGEGNAAIGLARAELATLAKKERPKLRTRALGAPQSKRFCLCAVNVPDLLDRATIRPTAGISWPTPLGGH